MQKKKAFLFFYFYWTLLGIFIAEKRVLKLHSWAVFSSMSGYKEDTTLCGLRTLLQVQNSSFWSTGIRRRQNFEIILKVKQQSMEFSFYFLSSPLPSPFTFLVLFFSFFARQLVGFILMGKGFGRAFRMLGLDERNVGANFWKLYMFFFFFCLFLGPSFPWLNHAHSLPCTS